MTVAENLRAIASEARPAIKQWLDAAELLAGFRDAAKEKGINWTQLKSLLVAEARDNEDGGTRLKDLAEKLDLALTYANMLANVSEHRKVTSQFIEPAGASSGEAAVPAYPLSDRRIEPDKGSPAASTNTVATSPGNGGAACVSITPPTPHDGIAAPTISDDADSIPDVFRRNADGSFVGAPT
jgi:hypothetical protein